MLASELVRFLEEFIDEKIEKKLATLRASSLADHLVDLATVPPGKRRNYRAARDGEIAGAVRLQRRWHAPRAAYEAWRASIAVQPKAAPVAVEPGVSALDSMRARLGLVRRSA